ncbi:uncharacterized protein M421DRAFT_10163 [Didymella exigua CBS 183.55]|uniref:Uncharacterized protein n=1 Tax=Didymella exigua CBS 183.55 TaxID=1150837 RepID=A0A6A5R7J6_9PLEO|nr:uncharacterized protein M421DRAFT_10163 [Didymella exigua CBS 183.55]KAF1922934.1 hypothetical protein M421DRAFT_10163 [Didymella exigua CBS 183.55]
MRTSQVLLWFGLAFLHQSVEGLPATFSINLSRDVHKPGTEAAGYHQHPRAEVKLGRDLGRRAPPKKGGGTPPKAPVVVPVPQTPAGKGNARPNTPGAPDKDKDGKGKGGPPSPPPGKDTDPVTPAPSKKGKDRVYKLGKCGSEDPGVEIKNVDSKGTSPSRKPKTPKPPKTPKAPKLKNRPDNDGGDDDVKPRVSGKKHMQVCGTKVDMDFPDYPSSGDAIEQDGDYWGKSLVAYNAVKPDPCLNDYTFGKMKYPKKKSENIHTPEKPVGKGGKQHTKDIWQTEHVMDAQIMKKFFQDMFQERDAVIKRDDIPVSWISSLKGKAAAQDQCSYLEQFWTKRWPSRKKNAMANLLAVFPGKERHEGEMLLLPGRLNNKKASLFSVKEYNVVSPVDFPNYSLHRKIDELREIILLIEYLNTPDVAKYFKALSVRIRDKLAKIDADGSDAFMRDTDDWWFKQKNDPTLKDALGEKYKSVKLATRWSTWINNFVTERTRAMQYLLIELFHVLDTDWEDAKTYVELQSGKGKTFKDDFEIRMKALRTNVKKAVKVQAYVIGSISSPNTPDVSDSEPIPEDDGNSDSDAPPETPTRPRPAPGQGQPINLPHRPAPPSVAGPSTPVPKSRRL